MSHKPPTTLLTARRQKESSSDSNCKRENVHAWLSSKPNLMTNCEKPFCAARDPTRADIWAECLSCSGDLDVVKGKANGLAQPGVIVQQGQSVVWVSFSSRVYRVAPEHLRCLSTEKPRITLKPCPMEICRFHLGPKDHGKGLFNMKI